MLQYLFDKIIGTILYIIFLPFRFVGSIIKKAVATTLAIIMLLIIIILLIAYATDITSIAEIVGFIVDMI